jgi:ubiquinone/menaquinone biosynthesis C-methylase UbiE
MSDAPSRFSAYRDLDSSSELAASVAWLDRVADLAPLRAGKRRSYELLNVGPGDRVLDVGCGTGVDVLAIAAMVSPGGEALGIDCSAGVLAAAQRAAAAAAGVPARFAVADAAALPFPEASFHACRCDRTLQHLPDPASAVNEMARVTRPGGMVAISETRNHVAAIDPRGQSVLQQILALDQARAEPAVAEPAVAEPAVAEPAMWVGFMLPLALNQAGLTEVRIESVQGSLHDGEQIASFYDLDRLSERAVADGRLSASHAAQLRGALLAESRAGRVTVVLETHIFLGRRPDG